MAKHIKVQINCSRTFHTHFVALDDFRNFRQRFYCGERVTHFHLSHSNPIFILRRAKRKSIVCVWKTKVIFHIQLRLFFFSSLFCLKELTNARIWKQIAWSIVFFSFDIFHFQSKISTPYAAYDYWFMWNHKLASFRLV